MATQENVWDNHQKPKRKIKRYSPCCDLMGRLITRSSCERRPFFNIIRTTADRKELLTVRETLAMCERERPEVHYVA